MSQQLQQPNNQIFKNQPISDKAQKLSKKGKFLNPKLVFAVLFVLLLAVSGLLFMSIIFSNQITLSLTIC